MRLWPTLALLGLATTSSVADIAGRGPTDEEWLTKGFLTCAAHFWRVEVLPHPEESNLIAAVCDTEEQWWGEVKIFHRADDKIDWIAKFPAIYSEERGNYIVSAKWQYLESLHQWVLEIFTSTHMGNGSLWLLAMDKRELRVLLRTVAVDKHNEHSGMPPPAPGGEVFENGRLQSEYRIDEKQHQLVVLSGKVIVLDGDDHELSRHPYSETWGWDEKMKCFQLINKKGEKK